MLRFCTKNVIKLSERHFLKTHKHHRHKGKFCTKFSTPILQAEGKVAKYTPSFLDKLSKSASNLTKEELVHVFFYINLSRSQLVDSNFEKALERYIYDLNCDELAVISMGFFKTQSVIRLKFLLNYMLKQTNLELATIHEISLSAILKVLRYSKYVPLIDQFMHLLDRLTPQVPRFSHTCCVHIALLGTTMQFFHEASLKAVSERLIKDITDTNAVRLKDMERILLALTMFDYDPKTQPDIYQSIYEELHKEARQPEFIVYYRCLQSMLNFLSLRKIYSYELMDRVFNPDYLIESYGKNQRMLPHNILSLDVCAEIECPDYTGNRLDKTLRMRGIRRHMEYTPTWDQERKLQAADQFYLTVLDTVTRVIGDQHKVQTHHVLPHFAKADIIFCRDSFGNYKTPTNLDNYQLGEVISVPKDTKLKWFAVIPLNWNNLIRGTSTPLGLIQMKCRQLKAIGYEPVMVKWSEMKDLNDAQKFQYISDRLNTKV